MYVLDRKLDNVKLNNFKEEVGRNLQMNLLSFCILHNNAHDNSNNE